ncbi:MAG: HupE/UreJ family protein, partial [Sulfurovum sp.]
TKAIVLLMLILGVTQADEIRPGYMEIKGSDEKTFQVKWKVPMKSDKVLSLKPLMPPNCKSTPSSRQRVDNALIENWTMVCPNGLAGEKIEISGLEYTVTDVLVQINHADGSSSMNRLTPTAVSFQIAAKQSFWDVAKTYTIIGIEHILFGIDHLLFVFALLIIVTGFRRLVGTITAFTLAHSITLVAATLGWMSVPQAPVEAVIALSILFLAVEIIHSQQGKIGLAEKSPWLIAFIFGLLHGFGFAGALAEVGLPQQAIPQALLFFNVGVELGQLMFVMAVLCVGWLVKKVLAQELLDKGELTIAYIIGSLSAFWLFERTYSFLV